MIDLIDRQAAMSAIENAMLSDLYMYEPFGGENAITILEQVPSAWRWVQVHEQVPEFGQYVLVTCYGEVYIARYTGNSWIIDGHEDVSKDDVDAWMILPMPYGVNDV